MTIMNNFLTVTTEYKIPIISLLYADNLFSPGGEHLRLR